MSSPCAMASLGHSGSQAPQLMHSSVMMVATRSPCRRGYVARGQAVCRSERSACTRGGCYPTQTVLVLRSEEHTSELQSLAYLVCRLLLEKKKRSQGPTRRACSEPSSPSCRAAHAEAPSY